MSEQLTELPAVARNINLPCKKCGVDRFFVVVAHTNATSAKVKCEVCGAQKTYKLPSAKKPRASTGTKKTTPKKPDHSALWSELKTQIGTDNVINYDMKKKYPMAAAIEHPKFGLGFVTNSFHDKIEVAFQEGGRFLVHNRT